MTTHPPGSVSKRKAFVKPLPDPEAKPVKKVKPAPKPPKRKPSERGVFAFRVTNAEKAKIDSLFARINTEGKRLGLKTPSHSDILRCAVLEWATASGAEIADMARVVDRHVG